MLASTSPALAYVNAGNNHSLQVQDADPCPTPPTGVTPITDVDGDHYLKGTNGADFIVGNNDDLPDKIEALGGDDIICGLDGPDTLIGGPGHDIITGGAGNDIIEGQGGPDTIRGGLGRDNIRSDTSDDTIYANDDANTNDNEPDTINGGGGNNDTCYYTRTTGQDNDTATNCEVIHTP